MSALVLFVQKWYNEYCMYDPFAIEFIIRNKLLEQKGGDYIHVVQQMPLPRTFAIDYDKTIYRMFETKDLKRLRSCQYQSQADYIDSPLTIFKTRYENYFALNYHVYGEENGPFNPRVVIPIVDDELIENIAQNKLYDEHDKKYLNIFVKYFNGQDINGDDIDSIDCIDYKSAKEIYYTLLFLIFCIDYYIKKLLS